MNLDTATYARLVALLAEPDPADFSPARRGRRITQPGDPKRRQTVFLPLVTRWAQQRYVALDPDPYIGPARAPRLIRRRA